MRSIRTVLLLTAASAMVAGPATAAMAAGAPDTGARTTTLAAQTPDARQFRIDAAQARAGEFVKALGLDANSSLKVKDVLVDSDGSQHVRVDRTYRGAPVVGGDMVIDLKADGSVASHFATFDKPLTLPVTADMPVEEAKVAGVSSFKAAIAEEGHTVDSAKVTNARLVVLTDGDSPQVAYEVHVEGVADGSPSAAKVYLDADSGRRLAFDEQYHSVDDTAAKVTGRSLYVGTQTLNVTKRGIDGKYVLANPATGNYTTDLQHVTFDSNRVSGPAGAEITSSTPAFGDGTLRDPNSAAVDAQFGADTTANYLRTAFNRNGIWDNGKGARSRVHFGTGYKNAWWDGQQMTYGDGANDQRPLIELDVTAHEMAHGVTQNTARLAYYNDAGGLNEATSDILGTAVEFATGNPGSTPNYLMGERLGLRSNGGPLRYMDLPSKDGRSYDNYSAADMQDDPHYTSGPLNRWYYIASEGSAPKTISGVSYDPKSSVAVKGIGNQVAAKIWYRTLSTKLTSRSTMPQAREGAIKSAIEMYGASSNECRAVEGAMNAIKVPAGTAKCEGSTPAPDATTTPVPPKPTETTPVPSKDTGVIVNGDFSKGSDGWQVAGGAEVKDGAASLGARGYVQQDVSIPSGSTMTFSVKSQNAVSGDSVKVQFIDPVTRITYTLKTVQAGQNGTITVPSNYLGGRKMTVRLVASAPGGTQFTVDDVTMR